MQTAGKALIGSFFKIIRKRHSFGLEMENFVSIQEFEDHALRVLPEGIKNYYLGTNEAQKTTKLNKETFEKYRIRPKLLRDVSQRNIGTTILGEKVSMPLGISPTSNQKLGHLDGECAVAKAAETAGTIFILSSASNYTIQEVANAAPKAIKWQQICIHKDRDTTVYVIRKAEQAGFKAIVVSIDMPIVPKSKNSSSLLTSDITFAIYKEYLLSKYSNLTESDFYNRARALVDDSVTWQDILWLKSVTKLPIVVKGVLTAEDAIEAINHGANAILVSNHGGRQLPSTSTTIEALPEIVAAVGNKVEIYIDGGIRHGTDVFKALALGAKMVFVGRPMLWGLVCGGEKGSKAVLDVLHNEIDETFALAGCRSVQEVTRDSVKHESLYR